MAKPKTNLGKAAAAVAAGKKVLEAKRAAAAKTGAELSDYESADLAV